MADPFELIRRRNIMGNIGMTPTNPTDVMAQLPQGAMPPPSNDDYDVEARMRKFYNPETAAMDKFNQLMAQMPQRNRPGFFRTLASGVVGARGGPEAIQSMMFAPYNNQMADWQAKMQPAERAAQIERQGNVNMRTLATQMVGQELRDRSDTMRNEQTTRKQEETERKNLATEADKANRTAIYEFKSRNPNAKIVAQKGGNFFAIHPITGKPIDTGIAVGNMSEADRLAVEQGYALERIDATGKQARETEKTRQTGREALADIKFDMESLKKGTKGELPTQTRVRQFNAARQLFNSRPELAKFIKVGSPGSNDFKITPPNPGAFFSSSRGPTPDQYKEINMFIYGQPEPPTTESSSSVTISRSGAGSNTGSSVTSSGPVERLVRTVQNPNTGERRKQYSDDGGKTWKFEGQ